MANQYTFSTIQDQVVRQCKINSLTTELTTLVSNCIDMAYFDIVRENKPSETLKINQSLSVASLAAGTPVNLDVACISVERFRFNAPSITPPLRAWRLIEHTQNVPPAPYQGRPRAYKLTVGTTGFPLAVLPLPYVNIINTDVLTYDYYKAPDLFSTTPTIVYGNSWGTEIIKKAIYYVQTYMNKLDQANAIWATIPGQAPVALSNRQS